MLPLPKGCLTPTAFLTVQDVLEAEVPPQYLHDSSEMSQCTRLSGSHGKCMACQQTNPSHSHPEAPAPASRDLGVLG